MQGCRISISGYLDIGFSTGSGHNERSAWTPGGVRSVGDVFSLQNKPSWLAIGSPRDHNQSPDLMLRGGYYPKIKNRSGNLIYELLQTMET